ncbi:tRNA lysidine(34) synthetase TilS [Corynebacterium poyangense]|uniref:tRNA(Ile)-lysidine synthase n=1 Tax=Corynebacterium poyangense TaxID=2684405 RepID=A0A7H0SR74_9CORY|nr:tRNA lysidine(34) synthetase TilS [Corynebacterium poyangense]QNQ91049.1 tRNA lysidine(34) synthetase TilS [Corynebacterium poyangense]
MDTAKGDNFGVCRAAVKRAWKKAPSDNITIALSGGPDSLALVMAMSAEGIPARVAIVDHGLQQLSDKVATHAQAQARRLGYEAEVIRLRLDPRASNMEARARQARYQALRDHSQGGDIWVGHTADDQAETLLLGALRGNPSGMKFREGDIVRPLLTIRRSNTIAACYERGFVSWRDPHNDQTTFRRVAIRHQVIPLLRTICQGDPIPALAMTAEKLAEDCEYLDAQVPELTSSCQELAELAPALRRRTIAQWLREHGAEVTTAAIKGVEEMCVNWRGQGPVAVGGTSAYRLVVQRKKGYLETSTEPR